jgi:hypothetical protein
MPLEAERVARQNMEAQAAAVVVQLQAAALVELAELESQAVVIPVEAQPLQVYGRWAVQVVVVQEQAQEATALNQAEAGEAAAR